MLLALDIGNSSIIAGLFQGQTLIDRMSVPSTLQRTSQETWSIFSSFLDPHLHNQRLKGVGLSSVVPFHTALFSSLVREKLGLEPLVINGSLNIGIHVSYKNPDQLGSDRLCGAVAGFAKYGGPLIIIDFGTATTYGVIDENGDFLGGAISLGVKANAEALYIRTARLPQIHLTLPPQAICTETISGMQAGTMFGVIDAVEGMVRRMHAELGRPAKVIATGGLSELMSKQISIINAHEPALVLEGIRLIYERTRR